MRGKPNHALDLRDLHTRGIAVCSCGKWNVVPSAPFTVAWVREEHAKHKTACGVRPHRKKDPQRSGVVIYDPTFGWGSRLEIREGTWTEKTLTIGGIRHKRGTYKFAEATDELAREANEINKQADALLERKRAFEQKLKEQEPR